MKRKINALLFSGFLLLFLNGCKEESDCTSNTDGRTSFKVKFTQGQLAKEYPTLKLAKDKFTTFDSNAISGKIADSALIIASKIFNSPEFKQKLSELDFRYDNHCSDCGHQSSNRDERIPGAEVLDSLFKRQNVILELIINNGRCRGALGSTCPQSSVINSNFKAIKCDMGNLPIEYAYAVHICHEYMHIVGYCHTNHKDDVAEEVGWIAYYIVLDWLKP
ncbi:hypothetical protein [Flavobacterium wongokense]|uniref:hypothetical protein n=1 Tax=Flavobacterium wongokense TaxID=2910674 RepID=UPI001F19F1D2|nr:hypothetical protein [Flavobacterium sp. WG47]MCF6131941.1 hypothetical protein [Flavobacterium sp. WG47]